MKENTDRELENRPQIEWSVFPMGEKPVVGVMFWVLICFVVWMVYWNVQSILLTAALSAILLVSLSEFYLPTHYLLDSNGVQMRRWFHKKQMDWKRVRSVSEKPAGIFLSPFPIKSRLESFRGLFLPYRKNSAEILSTLRIYAPHVKGLPQQSSDGNDDNNV